MKKLMTAIAAVTAAFGLYAADPVEALHGASMEADDNYIVDEGVFGDAWDEFWATDGDTDAAIVKAFAEGEEIPANLNYDCFNESTQLNYLKLETEAPLYRAIERATGTGVDNLVHTPIDEDLEGAPRDGIMIDQLVKFTAFEAETEAVSLDGNEKIAVWVKADADDDTKGTLQIATAALDSDLFEPTEKRNIDTEIEINLADWYQLKITAIKAADMDGYTVPGFIVELDGETIGLADGLWPEGWDDIMTPQAQDLIAQKKLFPSMVAYNAGSGANDLVGIAYKGTGAIDDVAVANYVAEEPEENEAEVNGEKYATIALAIEAANDGNVVTILKNVELADTLVINKAILLEMNGCKIKLAADKKVGIDITADAEISNGSITSTLEANVVGSKAINIPNKNVTLTGVDIDASFYEYAIYANCDDDCGGDLAWFYTDTEGKFATLSCDDVSIMGNGSLFHIEGMIATLNDCEATYDDNELFANEAHRAAVYSSVNADTTITGSGTYEHENALQSGNLGGKITVAADSTAEFIGDIKSFMKVGAHTELEQYDDYVAKFTFGGGTYDGTIVFVDEAARDFDIFVKGEAVEIEPPKGYQWNEETGVLELIPPTPTYTLTVTAPENGTLTTDPEAGEIEAGTTVTVTAEPAEGYELESIMTNNVPLAEGVTEFVMPAEAVTVAATFKLASVLHTVRWNAPENVASIVAKVNGDEIEQGDEFETGTEVEFTVQTANYYGYDTENPPAGWEILDDTTMNTTVSGTFVVGDTDLDVTIPTPAGKTYEINYKWYNNDEGGAMMAPLKPNDLPPSFVYGETVEFKPEMVTDYHSDVESVTITPRLTDPITGYVQIEITFKKGGWDPTVDPTVPASDKGIEGKLANASFKDLSNWAMNNSVEFKAGNMDEYVDAFLLDCAPDDVETEKENFKFASITQNAEGEWVVEINNEEIRGDQHFYGNGIAIITRYSDVTCETPADDGNFFKASLEVYSVATPE